MHRSILSIGPAAILVLGTFLAYNFAVAQEDHEHAEHAAEIAVAGPSVDDASLAVEPVVQGLVLPTAMAFLDERRTLVLEKDNGTIRMVEDGVRGQGNEDSRISSNNDKCESNTINNNLEISGEEKSFSDCDINGNLKIDDSEVRGYE
jgi:glucose/arabinose dehydrogenase